MLKFLQSTSELLNHKQYNIGMMFETMTVLEKLFGDTLV